ncbi:MAG: hypothetical protein AB8G11_06940, partial [Saprospiraceae bacterium]
MLHSVSMHNSVNELNRIVEFQREILIISVRMSHLPFSLTKDFLIRFIKPKEGEWLWKKMWTQPRNKNGVKPPLEESTFNKKLQKLIDYLKNNVSEGKKILDAFDNDIEFHKHLNNPDFRFQYLTLTENTQNAVKPLMIAFYEDLLKSGFIQEIHKGVEASRYNRDKFIGSFWKVNNELEVCPACDRERSDKVDDKVYDDADHFLPKSVYPFLSLHPYNLFPLCIYCNRSFKGDRDSVDNHNNAPLPNIFHPYLRPALHKIRIDIERNDTGVVKSVIEDIEQNPSRRLNSLFRVFKLDTRWVDRLRHHRKNIIDDIISDGKRLRRRHGYTIENFDFRRELRTTIREMLDERIEKLGKKVGFI